MIKIAKSELGRIIAKNRQRRHVIVADGVYEQHIAQKEDDWLDCIEGEDEFGPLCRGGCENPRESCNGYYGTDPDGGAVFWCMCDRKAQRNQLFHEGLKKAQELLTPDEFEQYKKDIMEELSIKE